MRRCTIRLEGAPQNTHGHGNKRDNGESEGPPSNSYGPLTRRYALCAFALNPKLPQTQFIGSRQERIIERVKSAL